MSKFTVRVEILAFPKGMETITREEEYTSWKEADTAFCAYRDLSKLKGSIVQHAVLIEHREETIRKEARKGVTIDQPTGVVSCFARPA
jgi:hypothetical protein